MEIATIEIIVRSQQAVQANKEVQDAFVKTEKVSGGAVEKMGKSFDRLKTSIFSVRGALTTLTAGLGFAGIVATISEFETALSMVRGALQATDKEMEQVSRRAREIGASSTFGATNAAKAMEAMGKAGFSLNQTLDDVVKVLEFAKAGSLDLSEAASIARRTIGGFGLEMSQLNEVMDTLTLTALKADTDVRSIAGALRIVAPAARDTGQDLKDVAAVLGVLGSAGIEAGQAGMSMRMMLQSLASPSKNVAEILKGMGLNLKDVNPRLHSMTEIIETLAKANMGLEEAQGLFGSRVGTNILALTKQIPELKKLRDEQEKAAGTTKRLADTYSDNLAGAFKKLKGAFTEIILSTGDAGLSGALRTAVEWSTKLLLAMSNLLDPATEGATAFNALATTIKLVAGALAGLALGKMVGQLITFIDLTWKATAALRAMAAGQLAFNAVMLVSPISAVLVVVGLLAAAYLVFANNARSAAGAQGDFEASMGRSESALRAYHNQLKETTAEQQKTIKTGLEVSLERQRADIAKTRMDLAALRKDMSTSVIGSMGPAQFSETGKALNSLIDQFKAGTINIDKYYLSLTAMGEGTDKAANRARILAKAVSEGMDQYKMQGSHLATMNAEFGKMEQAIAGTLPKVAEQAGVTEETTEETEKLAAALDLLQTKLLGGGKASEEFQEYLAQVKNAFESLRDTYLPLEAAAAKYKATQELIAEAEKNNIGTEQQRIAILGVAREEYEKSIDPLKALHGEMDRELELLKMTDEQRQISIQLYGIEMQMKEAGINLTQEEIAGLQTKLELIQQENKDLADAAAIIEAVKSPTEEYADEIERLTDLYRKGKLEQDVFMKGIEMAKEKLGETKDSISVFADEAARQSLQIFADFLFDPFTEGLDGMVEDFGKAMLRIAANQVAAQLLGSLGAWGTANAGAGGLGGAIAAAASFMGGTMDSGGRGQKGVAYAIGTGAQPEMFIPDEPGTFMPKQALMLKGMMDPRPNSSNESRAIQVVQNITVNDVRGSATEATQSQVAAKAAMGLREAQRRNW